MGATAQIQQVEGITDTHQGFGSGVRECTASEDVYKWQKYLTGMVGVQSVTPEFGPTVGEAIPSFTALDQSGRPQTLETISGPAGAVVVFVRSADW